MDLKEYQKEIKEQKDLIESTKKEFIKQCKIGLWHVSYRYNNEVDYRNDYFTLKVRDSGTNLSFDYNEVNIKDIGIGWFKFWILRYYIKKSVKRVEKDEELQKAYNFSKKFFEKNRQLKRESRIDTIIK